MLELSIDRTGLSKPALVFTSDPASGLWVPEDGLGRPAMGKRRKYAAESPWIDGSTLVASVKVQSSLPVQLYVQGATVSELEAAMDELEEALDQFSFETTVTINGGAPVVWSCDDADYDWGEVDSGMTRAFMARASVTIPVHPIPGSP